MSTDTITATIDTHLEAYLETDLARRAQLIRDAWAMDGHLIDPPLEGRGHEGLNEMFATVQGQFAGHRFRRSTGIDEHHGIARYGWELVAPDGAVALMGMDVAVLDGDGKLSKVAGFFGEIPNP